MMMCRVAVFAAVAAAYRSPRRRRNLHQDYSLAEIRHPQHELTIGLVRWRPSTQAGAHRRRRARERLSSLTEHDEGAQA